MRVNLRHLTSLTIGLSGMTENSPSSVPSIGRPRTTEETCEFFKVKRNTLWRWRRDGLLTCSKINGTVRFTDEQIADCLDRQSEPAASPPPTPNTNPKYPHLGQPTQ